MSPNRATKISRSGDSFASSKAFGFQVRAGFSVLALAICVGSAHAVRREQMKSMPDTVLPVLRESREVAATRAADRIEVAVSLRPLRQEALEAFCDAVSDRRSPQYRRFLSPDQVGTRFGASASQQSAVIKYLKSKGLTITLAAPNRMAILASGTVGQVASAFNTTIKEFVGPAADRSGEIRFRANTTPIQVPNNISSYVIDVSGVETYTRPKARNTTTLTPPLVRALYNAKPIYNALFQGQGRTIGISSWDGFRLTDAASYISQYNLPTPIGGATSNIQVIAIDGGSGSGAPSGEGDLDIQMVLGMAPLANIIIYDGGAGLLNVLTREATDNKADIITESYGWNLSVPGANAAHNQHLAMTAQGITYMCASGDFGTDFGGFDYPNYDPEVLMVGGTVATVNDTTGARVQEVGWSGSGGGWSLVNASFNVLPAWQVGNGVPTSINKRLVPDISVHADGSGAGGYFIFNQGSLISISGTSASSPTFAGGLGLVEQELLSLGGLPTFGAKNRLGRIQNVIYQQNGRSDVYLDITSGANGTLPNGQSSTCTPGWDFVTGFGVIDFDKFCDSFASSFGVDVPPTSATTVQGTYQDGDLNSILDEDGDDFILDSYMIDNTGNPVSGNAKPSAQVASMSSDFTVDLSSGTLSDLKAEITGSCSVSGVSGQVFGYNWSTGNYELATSFGLYTSQKTVKVNISKSKFSKFVDGSGNIRLLIRGISAVRGISGKVPPQFELSFDKIELKASFSN